MIRSQLNKLSFSLVMLLLITLSPLAKADHIIGSDLTYTCSNTNDSIYDVTFNFYRDCNGCYVLGQSPKCGTSENCASSLTAPTSISITCATSGSSLGTFSMKRTSIVDITKTCRKVKSRCQQPCNGSFPYGIEKHTFKGTLDLRNAIKKGCFDIEISVLLYVRNVGITTGQRTQRFYTFAKINACLDKCNSSPTLTNDPVAILCCNQKYVFNNGAVDFKDHDSLSYAFAPAYQGRNQLCTYTPPNSAKYPITAYYPSGLKYPYSNPAANPPIGLYLDEKDGTIICTPTKCDQIAVVVMEMREWRKDSTGKYQLIGVTRRDMQFIVTTCPDNNPPSITNSKFSFETCEGQEICFNINTDDKVFKPPPPLPTPDPDTTQLTWNRGIPGATFTILDTSARLKKAQFCWTPPEGSASSLPYTFTATVTDNACPKNASAVRAFSIRVKKTAQADRDIDTLDCGKYSIESNPEIGFQGTPTYQWQILDSTGKTIFDRNKAFFVNSSSTFSFKKQDTIRFRTGGKYIIRHQINNSPINCPMVYFDTLVVPPLLEVGLALGPDTFACEGEIIRLEPQVKNSVSPLHFKWDNGDTSNYLDVQMPASVNDTIIGVFLKDGSGCTAWDSVTIYQRPNPVIKIGPDRRICWYDTIHINSSYDFAYWNDPRDTADTALQQGDTLYISWTRDGVSISTDTQINDKLKGLYIATVTDSLGCKGSDTMFLFVNDTIYPDAGPDREKCWNDELVLIAGGLDTSGNDKTGLYRWYDITSSAPNRTLISGLDTVRRPILTSTDFELDVVVTEDTTSCILSDTVKIKVNALPVLDLPPDQSICCDEGTLTLSGKPAGGKWYDRKNPTFVDNFKDFVTDRACNKDSIKSYFVTYVYTDPTTTCTNEDSIEIQVNPLPVIELLDGYFCQDKELVNLQNDIVYVPKALGNIQQWNCINCGTYNWNDILVNLGDKNFPDYALQVGKGKINLGNKTKDSITIEVIYGNQQGCFARDTSVVTITKVPEISIKKLDEYCYDHGVIDLISETGVTPKNGKWITYDTIIPGVKKLNGALSNDSLNTLLTDSKGGKYYLRYFHDASGCPTYRDTIITIHPLPEPIITRSPFETNKNSEPYPFCEDNDPVVLDATPKGPGGTYSSDYSGAVSGGRFIPSGSPTQGPFWVRYIYKDEHGCIGSDSVQVEVFAPPSINILNNDTAFCLHANMELDIAFEVENSDESNSGWIFPGDRLNSILTTGYTRKVGLPSVNDSTSVFTGVAYANDPNEVCDEAQANLTITVHPVPEVNITPDDPDGCQPHDVNFTTTFNNRIDSTTATYAWDFGDGGTSTLKNPFHSFNTINVNKVQLTVTSAFGCDSTFPTDILVYPNPIAAFTPDPNNSTTAALPRFRFDNNSTVDPALGSTIDEYYWDFGDPNRQDDISSDKNPTWVYGTDTATYQVKLVARTNHGCVDSILSPVIIGPDILVFIPNAFTPNKSGTPTNEGFRAVTNDGVKTYHLIIFNRWGELLWETNDQEAKWDGTYKGVDSQPDVYSYYLEVVGKNDKVYSYAGTFTLLR